MRKPLFRRQRKQTLGVEPDLFSVSTDLMVVGRHGEDGRHREWVRQRLCERTRLIEPLQGLLWKTEQPQRRRQQIQALNLEVDAIEEGKIVVPASVITGGDRLEMRTGRRQLSEKVAREPEGLVRCQPLARGGFDPVP